MRLKIQTVLQIKMSKQILLILFILGSFIFKAQTWDMYKGDTINKIDVEGRKQGRWVVMGKHKPGTCYQPEQKIEEGKLKD